MLRIILAIVALCAALPALAGERMALVIGNAAYRHTSMLPNPPSDARAIAASLERLNFDVTLAIDLAKPDFEQALADFSERALSAEIVLVFYAGHGMEMDGRNYLLPVDARLKSDVRVKFETIALDDVLTAVEASRGLKIVLLDACRDNPFLRTMKRRVSTRSVGRGLAKVETTSGLLVSYAAAAGTVAEDGEGPHSPYTEALLAHLETPGLELSLLFRKVADDVQRRTAGRQTPFEYGRLPGTSIFLKPPEAEPAEASQAKDDLCRDAGAHWNSIAGRKSAALLADHLARFGDCAFATLARVALEDLRASVEAGAVEEVAQAKAERARAEGEEAAARAKAAGAEPAAEAEGSETAVETAALEPATLQADGDDAAVSVPAEVVPADPVAGEPTPEEAVPEELAREALALAQQRELERLGCEPGVPDGAWGRRSRAAMARFNRETGLSFDTASPTSAALESLKTRPGRVCPLVCSPLEVLSEGRCIAKTCPAGERLNSAGQCYKPKATVAATSDERKKSGATTRTVSQKERTSRQRSTARKTAQRERAKTAAEAEARPRRNALDGQGFTRPGCIVITFCDN